MTYRHVSGFRRARKMVAQSFFWGIKEEVFLCEVPGSPCKPILRFR